MGGKTAPESATWEEEVRDWGRGDNNVENEKDDDVALGWRLLDADLELAPDALDNDKFIDVRQGMSLILEEGCLAIGRLLLPGGGGYGDVGGSVEGEGEGEVAGAKTKDASLASAVVGRGVSVADEGPRPQSGGGATQSYSLLCPPRPDRGGR